MDPLAALSWQIDAGADEAIGNQPVNRLAPQPAKAPAAPAAVPMGAPARSQAPSRQAPSPYSTPGQGEGEDPAAQAAAEADAKSLAASAQSLAELEQAIARFEGCALKKTATKLVFADGNPDSGIMLIGEAPGRDEDMEGRPFVGRSGQLLDRMLAAAGFNRDKVYIANCLPWRPPGNRGPTTWESQLCLPFLLRQIELAGPRLVVFLGATPFKLLTGSAEGITRARGRWVELTAGTIAAPALPTYHPAYLLRNPSAKREAWRDILTLQERAKTLGL